MQLRLPWILSRKRLVISALADATLFALVYYVLHQDQFVESPSFSLWLALLFIIWSLGSYVFGRYANGTGIKYDRPIRKLFTKQLTGTVVVFLLTLGVTLLCTWLFSDNSVQALHQIFFISFLGIFTGLSALVQLALRLLMTLRGFNRDLIWLYIGSDSGLKKLREMSKLCRVQVCVKHLNPHNLKQVSPPSQYIVDNFYDHPTALLRDLYLAQQEGSSVLSRLAWCELTLQRFPSEFLTDSDLLDGCFFIPKGTLQSRIKRVGDVAVASILLVITSPLVLISALLIKVTDGGPIFYSQIRTGLNGNHFKIWKLRSMRIDAEHQGAQWSTRVDPRITKIGSLLRRTRLDELPQLWCVLT